MNISICGIDCSQCEFRNSCEGCITTNGRPFGGECIAAECCHKNGFDSCAKCSDLPCRLKQRLIAEFNDLGIKDMSPVTDLNLLVGSYINLEYRLPNGQSVKLLDDKKIYFGNQICKNNGHRCYGLTANNHFLLVCEYGENGSEPEIIVYKKRNS